MSSSERSAFVYVTYIRTTQEKLWTALTDPEFTRQYFSGGVHDTDWKPGSPWKLTFPDGSVSDSGKIVDCDPPNRVVIEWQNEKFPALKEEGFSRCTIELEPENDTIKLSILHEIDIPDSQLIKGVSGGWPKIISSLKTLLETGEALAPPLKGCQPPEEKK